MSFYSIILISSILVPLALSFDKQLQFYKQWKYLFPSIIIVAAFYILCDYYLTRLGIWGFNPLYHSNILLLNLPLEEWLFFIVIPYASIFLHESFILYFPQLQLSSTSGKTVTILLIFILTIVVILNTDKIYTFYIFSLTIIALIFSIFDKTQVINSFFITFLLIIVPFFIVNALLTGSFIGQEVVWYNNNENLRIRFLTIPVEDFGYAFSMILFNLLLKGEFEKYMNHAQKIG
jgi:lycopene cyclase domain-containing protein